MSLFKQWRKIGLLFKHRASSVVYCDVKEGCKYAIQNMFSNNGIARAPNGTFYVAHTLSGGLSVLEEQSDNTLVITDHIQFGALIFGTSVGEVNLMSLDAFTDDPLDNLSIDSEGHVWAAGDISCHSRALIGNLDGIHSNTPPCGSNEEFP